MTCDDLLRLRLCTQGRSLMQDSYKQPGSLQNSLVPTHRTRSPDPQRNGSSNWLFDPLTKSREEPQLQTRFMLG